MEHNSELEELFEEAKLKAVALFKDDHANGDTALYGFIADIIPLIEEHDRQVAIKELNLCKERYHNIHSGFGLCVPEDYVEMRISELQSPTQKENE